MKLFARELSSDQKIAEAALLPFLLNSTYNASGIENSLSASQVSKSLKKLLLQRLAYKQKLVKVDIEDNLDARIGQSVHTVIEDLWGDLPKTLQKLENNAPLKAEGLIKHLKKSGVRTEVGNKLQLPSGNWITGTFDLEIGKILMDYKVVKTFSADKLVDTYLLAMSTYRLINPDIGIKDIAYLLTYFKDWSLGFKQQALKYGKPYPPKQSMAYPLKLLSETETLAIVEPKVDEYVDNLDTSVEEINDKYTCTSEDLWQGEGVFKYFKNPSSKRATKVIGKKADYIKYISKNPSHKSGIVHFPDDPKACNYCTGSIICKQGQRNLKLMSN